LTKPLPKAAPKNKKKINVQKLSKVFIDVSFAKEVNKKDSYENREEAEAVADYLVAYCESKDPKKIAVMSPFRTQALVIKNVILEERKDDLPKSLRGFGAIGSFEDFVSCQYETVIVSLCKT
jgi:superfamily I DNA and/or RNA helicase